MSQGKRRTRPWSQLKGASRQANDLALLLRGWLDEADVSLDDLMAALRPEHFKNGRVPSRTSVSERLAGVRLQWDFVEAVADVCSTGTEQQDRMLAGARSVQDQEGGKSSGRPGPCAPESEHAAELVAVQRESLAVSDKLVRAMERAVELERERNTANQMVLLLLAMVDKLQRDIAALAAERGRRRRGDAQRISEDEVRSRLARSEEQRRTAESELERARVERDKADRLAEEAADQVQALAEELERLRQIVPQLHDKESTPASSAAPAIQSALHADADDIDQALAKAAQHLDDGADRLDRLADELHQNNSSDNPLVSTDSSDNPDHLAGGLPGTDGSEPAKTQALREEALRVYKQKREYPDFLPQIIAGEQIVIADLVEMLRDEHLGRDADAILDFAGEHGPTDRIVLWVRTLRRAGRDADTYRMLNSAGTARPSDLLVGLVDALREAGHESDAYQVLTAVGRHRPAPTVPSVLEALSHGDSQWTLAAAQKDRSVPDRLELASALSQVGRHEEAAAFVLAETRLSHAHTDSPTGPGESDKPRMVPSPKSPPDADMPPPPRIRVRIPATAIPPLDGPETPLRPYAVSGGRSRPRFQISNSAVLTTTAEAAEAFGLLPEHRRICQLCEEPKTIGEISHILSMPLGVARILAADLAETGMVTLHQPESTEN